jgi:hypothetical protein
MNHNFSNFFGFSFETLLYGEFCKYILLMSLTVHNERNLTIFHNYIVLLIQVFYKIKILHSRNHSSTNNCTSKINCHSMVPYICFVHYMTIIRGIYIYIYICTSLRAVHFCSLICGCIIDVVMLFYYRNAW